jgi:hypothetical protein
MKKASLSQCYADVGKYCIDISKVVITTVVIAPFVSRHLEFDVQLGLQMILGGAASIFLLATGIFFSVQSLKLK